MKRQRLLVAGALILLAASIIYSVSADRGTKGGNALAELVASTERTVAAPSIRADTESVAREGELGRPQVHIFQAPDRVKTLTNPGRPGAPDPRQTVRVGDATYVSADRPGTYYRSDPSSPGEPAFPGWAELKLVLGADSVARDGPLYSFHYKVQLTDAVADVRGEATVEDGYLSRLHIKTSAGDKHSDTTIRYSAIGSAPPVDVPPESAVVPARAGAAACGDGGAPDAVPRCRLYSAPGPVQLPLVVDPTR